MENFDEYWTIEEETSKGWEVIWTCHDMLDAIEKFRSYAFNNPGCIFRCTSNRIYNDSRG